MLDAPRELLVHAVVAALVVTAFVRTWRVEDPSARVRFGWLALVLPVATWAAASGPAAVPGRGALFDSAAWNDVRVLGIGAADALTAGFMTLGLALLLRDLVPWAAEQLRGRAAIVPAGSPCCAEIHAALAAVAGAMRVARPRLMLVDTAAPVVLCTGVTAWTVVVSRGAYERLDAEELRAALAHELAHVERRDPAVGWAVMLVRAVLWFNPVAQVLGRDLVQVLERRADDRAAAVTGTPVALASAILKVLRGTRTRAAAAPWAVPGFERASGTLDRAQTAVVEARCRRLLDAGTARPEPLPHVRLVLAAAGAAGLLLFVR